MGYDMLRFKVFRDAIMKLDQVMNHYGIKIYENILNKNAVDNATESNVILSVIQVRMAICRE